MAAPRRPAHKAAHPECPWGATNWADCDVAAAHQWGRCKAIVGKYEPDACTRWAADAEGYCGQHYVARIEDDKRKARETQTQLQLTSRIDAYIMWRASHPHVWDMPGTEEAPAPKRKGPHRLTELA